MVQKLDTKSLLMDPCVYDLLEFIRRVRVSRAANLVLFVVDASWSMAVAERMGETKGAVLSLLINAYQQRDCVGLEE